MTLKVFILGCIIGITFGIGITFMYSRFHEKEALVRAAMQASVVKEQMNSVVKLLNSENNKQAEEIQKLSNVMGSISNTVNGEVNNVQDALNIIKSLKEQVRSLP